MLSDHSVILRKCTPGWRGCKIACKGGLFFTPPKGVTSPIWGPPPSCKQALAYCHLVWHFCNASDRRKLERVQERALRAVYKTRSASYQELLDRAKLTTLHNRRLQDMATLMFQVKHSLVPLNISDLFYSHSKKLTE